MLRRPDLPRRRRLVALAGAGLLALVGCAGAGADTSPSTAAVGDVAGSTHGMAAPTTVPTAPLRAGESFQHLGLGVPGYLPAAPAGGTDDYRCFLLDPQVTAPAYVTGVTVLPGNPDVVHHAILFRTPPEQVAAAEAADAAAEGPGWTCFGGTGLPAPAGAGAGPTAQLDAAPWLGAWAPGAPESVFPAGTGVRLDAGSRIVLQMHYNLLGGTGADTTQVRLRRAAPGSALTPLETMLLPGPVELPCAPGESGYLCQRPNAVLDVMSRFGTDAGRTVAGLQLLCGGDPTAPRAGPTQSCDRVVLEPTTIRAAAGHLHLLGRSIRIEVNPGRADAAVILDKPVWDFDDQGATPLPQPVTVDRGDTVRVTCTHDATLRARLPALRDLPPRYVVWGEGTSDEMCLGILVVTRP